MSLPQISAAEEIMRLALTGQQHLDALIGYYRSEIDHYNDERAEWALHYEMLKDNASNKYTLQQEIDDSRHRINVMEGQLNTTKANLNKERQKYFQMIENNQQVKERVEQNKKRYRDIVAVCKPISVGKREKKEKSQANSRLSQDQNQSKSQIELDLINLARDHDQTRQKLQKNIGILKQELDQLISEHSERGRLCSKQYKQMLEQVATAESKIMHLTIEYFKLRMNSFEDERRVQEQNQILRLKAVALAKKLQMLRDTHSQQFKSVDQEVKQRNKEYREKYDEQLRKKEEHLSMLKEQNERINDIYLIKLKKLEGELRTVSQRQKTVEERSKSQVSSLKGQIKILKSRLQKEGVREMRAQLADNDEQQSSGTLSMSELEKLNKEVSALKKKI